MTRRAYKQSGFTLLEVLAVVAVVAVVGAAGWFVYQHNRLQIGNAATGTAGQQETTTPPSATTVVKISELGVQITVANDIKDLTYTVKTNTLKGGTQATTAYFSTKALAALDKNCDAGVNTPLGTLQRVDGQYPTDPTAASDYGTLVKQFPTFYISEGYPNGSCTSNASAAASASKFKDEFQAAIPSVAAAS